MTPENIVELFRLCVENTYFIFNGKLYIQVYGLAIGAATSGFAADIFMENLEKRALQTFANPPSIWKRYVDDTLAKLKIIDVDNFLTHLNSLHPRIKFTTELMQNRTIAFLDTEIMIKSDNTINIKVYRKPTHTDQYLAYTSNHHIKQKLGIISTFRHRIDNLITTDQDIQKEEIRMRKAMRNCGYPEWTFKKPKKRNTKKITDDENMPVVSLPYVKNISEKVARTFKRFGMKTIHKPSATIKNILVKTKDPVHKLDKPGAIYHIKCKQDSEHYVGETDRPMKVRGYEHKIISHKEMTKSQSLIKQVEKVEEDNNNRRSTRLARKERINYKKMNEGEKYIENAGTSEVAKHMMDHAHCAEDMELQILGYERNWKKRGIKEAINIRRLAPTLNQDKGRHNIGAIWNHLIGGKADVRKTDVRKADDRTEKSKKFPPKERLIIDNAQLEKGAKHV